MAYILLIGSTLLLFLGHLFKVYRWQQFIEIYEKPKTNNLLQSLSLGYIINFIVPFRIGDIVRIWFSGRKMQNGLSFSFATVIIDRILDIISVGFIFLILYISGFNEEVIRDSFLFYGIASIVIITIIVLGYLLQKYIKKMVRYIARIFNPSIELKILKTSYFGITSFKNIFISMSKIKLICYTIFMWGLYLGSYALFAKSLELFNYNYSFVEVVISLFSKNTLNISLITLVKDFSDSFVFFIFIATPLVLMIFLSFIIKPKKDNNKNNKYLKLLPHKRGQDRLVFLEAYFSGQKPEYFKTYLKLNQDISILQDLSAGSNATTILCTKDKEMFFRKYAIGKDSEKLYEQILWLQNHKNLKITKVLNVKHGNDYCCYDMPYYNNATTCFNYVHSSPIETSWKIIEKCLNDLDKKLYKKNVRKAKKEIINKYIDEKIIKNIKKIENGNYIKPLLKYDTLIINGKSYKNLNQFDKYFDKDYLYSIFKNDKYSDIHGDLTIENIIVMDNKYYIIDPNTGNLHDSRFLDYSKLLQSLHGNYEFYMNTDSVDVIENRINYLFTKSYTYDVLYKKYHEYLSKKFNKEELKSIYFHEIVHWLRLLPYKIDKNGIRSVLFYAAFIIILNDIMEMYGDD